MLTELENYFSSIDLQIKGEVKWVEHCGQGRYAEVFKIKRCYDYEPEEYDRAIKISLPKNFANIEPEKLKQAREDFLSEIKALYKLKHPNLPQIYEFGKANVVYKDNGKQDTIPYYIMEYLEGEDLEKFLKNKNNQPLIDEKFFLSLIKQTLSALSHCHSCQDPIIHLDIKPDNIFVVRDSDEFRFILADFGKSKNIRLLGDEKYTTIGGGVIRWVHPDLHEYLRHDKAESDVFRQKGYLFDLYSLGKVFQFVIKEIPSLKGKKDCHWNFFINDLCWHENHRNDFSQFIHYASTKEVFTKALRLINFKTNKRLSRLYDNDNNPTIRLSEDETMPFPSFVKAYVDTPEFQKLRNINQLAGTDLVYPGATHTRFVHSLGVYSKSILYVNSLLNNSLFYYLYDDFEIENLILCALLHDIGHYPFSHYFEEIKGIEELNVKHEVLTSNILSNKLSIKKAVNDSEYSIQYLSETKLDIAKKMCKSSVGELLSEKNRFENINDIWKKKDKYILFKDIIAGSIDCDKLDYLLRDSKNAGVTYGKTIDLKRFIMSLTIDYNDAIEKRDKKGFPNLRLAITPKGIAAVEGIISSRSHLFSEVYWHKTCRATTAMVKDAFWYASQNIKQKEFEWASLMLNDDEFLLFIAKKLNDIEIAMDLLGGIRNGYNRQLYKRLKTFSNIWNEEKYKKLLDNLQSDFSILHKKKEKFINEMNIGEQTPEWKIIKKHHLIIDVPDRGVDAEFKLNVKYPDEVEGKKYYDFHDFSGFETDINVSKKIRFFCHPDYYEQISGLKGKFDEYIERTLMK